MPGSFEKLSASLFHIATAGLIALAFRKNKLILFLIIGICLHAFVDRFAGYASKFPFASTFTIEILLFLFSTILFFPIMFYSGKISKKTNE